MADEAKPAVEQSAASEQASGSADSESGKEQGTQDSGQAASKENGTTEAGKPAPKADETGKDSGQGQGKTEPKEHTPKSRRSAEFRIQQQAKEIRQLKSKLGESGKAAESSEASDEDTHDTTKQPDDIEARIDAAVEKRLKPFESAHTKTADDAEINELFADKADEKTKYEPKIRDMWNLPSGQYKNLSAEDLYHIVSYDDAVTTAVAKAIDEYKKAEQGAKESSTGGNSSTNRPGQSPNPASDLSDEEFLKRNERIKAGHKD